MSTYSWLKYNNINRKLSNKIITFNKRSNINFIEKGLYNHIRDIFCLTIMLNRNKRRKTKILDYGSNLLALSNIKSKINIKLFDFYIYDPFFLKKIKNNEKPFEIKFITKEKQLKNKKFDIVNFGSSLQYIKDLNFIKNNVNLKNVNNILITHTPITLLKKYSSKQKNHKNLVQHIHSFNYLKKILKQNGYDLIFKSRNDDKYVACNKKKPKTFFLNLLFVKKNIY
jgi:hypothetical protein